MANSTQKQNNITGRSRKRKGPSVKIPELKRSFDQLERAVTSIIRETPSTKERVKKLQEVWRKIFGRPVESIAAEAYIQVMARSVGGRKGGKTRKQSGGSAALAGAPLDFQTRPGVDGVHGSFPPYLSNGLSFYNTINQEGMFKGCGTENITPNVPASLGSNQFGGATLGDGLFLGTTRPVDATVPASIFQDVQTVFQGRPLGASPDASQNQLKYV
jgi:hypothetical protein